MSTKVKNKTLIIEDCEYLIDRYYKEGAAAFLRSIPWSCNPYQSGSYRHDQWSYGHENQSAGYHTGELKCSRA